MPKTRFWVFLTILSKIYAKIIAYVKINPYLRQRNTTKTHNKMNAIAYTSREINKNFRIKVYGNGINKAVGCKGLVELLENDTDLINKILDKAFSSLDDKFVRKLRRGVKITFYWK